MNPEEAKEVLRNYYTMDLEFELDKGIENLKDEGDKWSKSFTFQI